MLNVQMLQSNVFFPTMFTIDLYSWYGSKQLAIAVLYMPLQVFQYILVPFRYKHDLKPCSVGKHVKTFFSRNLVMPALNDFPYAMLPQQTCLLEKDVLNLLQLFFDLPQAFICSSSKSNEGQGSCCCHGSTGAWEINND